MKRIPIANIVSVLLLLLFTYTATSKFLDYDRFVFQMKLAPVPLMKWVAPILGWLIPAIETLLVVGITTCFFIPKVKVISLYASVVLLSAFEIYIAIMLLSGSQLPCTCGGIISQMGWGQHLLFNAFFIAMGFISVRFKKINSSAALQMGNDDFKILTRA
jgi:putative oxidoreductase